VTEQLQQAADAKSAAETERDQLAAEKEQLLPQLEQARWQSRQLERKLEEATAGKNVAEQVRAVCQVDLGLLHRPPSNCDSNGPPNPSNSSALLPHCPSYCCLL
jgi:hypothetical protein